MHVSGVMPITKGQSPLCLYVCFVMLNYCNSKRNIMYQIEFKCTSIRSTFSSFFFLLISTWRSCCEMKKYQYSRKYFPSYKVPRSKCHPSYQTIFSLQKSVLMIVGLLYIEKTQGLVIVMTIIIFAFYIFASIVEVCLKNLFKKYIH